MNTVYAAALADEHRHHLRVQADEARQVRAARMAARSDQPRRHRLLRPVRFRLAFRVRQPVFIGRVRLS